MARKLRVVSTGRHRHQPGGQDVFCCVHIRVLGGTRAVGAPENRLALAGFRVHMPTRRAALRCERCRNLHYLCPAIARRRLQCHLEAIPALGQNGPVQPRLGGAAVRQKLARRGRGGNWLRATSHTAYRQLFQHHHGVLPRQLGRRLGTEVLAAAALTGPHIGESLSGLVSVGRSLGRAGEFALQPHSAPFLARCGETLVI